MDKGGALRQKALSEIPTTTKDDTEYLVAIASHRKILEPGLSSCFTWFKYRAKHTIRKVQKYYKVTTKTNCLVDLYDEYGGILSEKDTLLSLDDYGDHIIVLQAVEREASSLPNAAQQAVRSPLRPTNSFGSPSISAASDKNGSIPKYNHPGISANLPCASPYSKAAPLVPPPSVKQEAGHRKTPTGQQNPSFVPPSPLKLRIIDSSDMPGIAPYRYVKKEPSLDPLQNSAVDSHEQDPTMGSAAPTGAVSGAFQNASQNRRLLKLLAQGNPELLEFETEECEKLLETFKAKFSGLPVQSPATRQWLQQIETLKQRNSNEPTIIGVVGNTGAGKSSVINAMLDEERLVPTNCMRACTAVVTEMSWNPSQDENERYRSQVVFISPADWEKELKILHAEVLDGNGKVSSDAYKADSEAGIAYAKIRAVYPQKTKEELGRSSVGDLMRDPAVLRVLGQTVTIAEADSSKFYKILQIYVDSKEKATEDKKQKKEMEFWPLIKVVKIYTKADALSTGAMIVDLPGVHDSNAARSAIAQNYIKMCTGLWIVAPITRAVDDKAAKSLLGESFKRQLKYDGTYSRVTFICSKTDDISIIEASESLGLQEEMSSKWDDSDQIALHQSQLNEELEKMKETKDMYAEILNDTEDQLEIWERLDDDMDDGKTVYSPSAPSKRKRSGNSFKQRKKRESERASDNDEDSIDENFGEVDTQQDTPSQREPLTAESIQAKLAELRDTKKQARLHRRKAEARVLAINVELKVLSANYEAIEAQMSAICIAGRNQYSKGAIQQDFAAGIKELDQENQIEANEADFNPDEDLRDYAEVARSLPVFCVSSRAYQKLCGRLQRDKGVPGFGTVEETEIPQLQSHCKKLTEAGRLQTCRRFLNGFSQLVNSISLWAGGNGRGTLTSLQMKTEEQFLHAKLTKLEKQLENVVQTCLKQMKQNLATHIYNNFDQVVSAAVASANATAAKWGAPMNRLDKAAGGLHWCTYKAVVRRDGCFDNGVLHDFNLQLTEPIIKKLGSSWETVFARRLPDVLKTFTANCNQLLHSFHKDIEARVTKSGNGVAGLAMLGQQLENYERIFQDLTGQMLQVITENQREANREFTPAIARHLLSAYHYCAAERGTGSYSRMKEHLTGQIDEHRNEMFHESTEEVKTLLTAMCVQVEEHMLNRADEVFVLMRRDYMMAITGAHIPEGYEVPRNERHMKDQILQLIREREEAAEKEEQDIKDDDKDDEPEEVDYGGEESEGEEKEIKFERRHDEWLDEPLSDGRGNYIASEWDSYEDEVEAATDQLLRESFKEENDDEE